METAAEITLVRHGETPFTKMKKIKRLNPQYQEFARAFSNRHIDRERAVDLAKAVMANAELCVGGGDHDTPVTLLGRAECRATGRGFSVDGMMLPDIVFVSPYDRTQASYEEVCEGWPGLANVEKIDDERMREQEHGTALLYNDWRIFRTMHPDQDELKDLQGNYYYRYPQGENIPDLRERQRSLHADINEQYAGARVLMIGHHLQILATRANFEGFSPQEFLRVNEEERPPTASATKYEARDGGFILKSCNQTWSHLLDAVGCNTDTTGDDLSTEQH